MKSKAIILVGGVPCVGKSYFLRRLMAREMPALNNIIQHYTARNIKTFNLNKIADFDLERQDVAAVHIDLGGWLSPQRRKSLKELIRYDADYYSVTLVASMGLLRERHRSRLKLFARSLFGSDIWFSGTLIERLVRHGKLVRIYRNEARVVSIYEEWIRFVNELNSKGNMVVDCGVEGCHVLTGDLTLSSVSDVLVQK
ncbi:MAG: hypothetical protein JJT90_11165 [Ectothiorhodospiraceae bacterium]|nr:hypothetical protein [Ectothiorhodospiraceae bacterium]